MGGLTIDCPSEKALFDEFMTLELRKIYRALIPLVGSKLTLEGGGVNRVIANFLDLNTKINCRNKYAEK